MYSLPTDSGRRKRRSQHFPDLHRALHRDEKFLLMRVARNDRRNSGDLRVQIQSRQVAQDVGAKPSSSTISVSGQIRSMMVESTLP